MKYLKIKDLKAKMILPTNQTDSESTIYSALNRKQVAIQLAIAASAVIL